MTKLTKETQAMIERVKAVRQGKQVEDVYNQPPSVSQYQYICEVSHLADLYINLFTEIQTLKAINVQ